MGAHSRLTFTSLCLLLVQYPTVGLAQGRRVVLRGVSVLAAADGHLLSEAGVPSAIRSYRGSAAYLRTSVVFDCDYDILPDVGKVDSYTNMNSTETNEMASPQPPLLLRRPPTSAKGNATSMANNDNDISSTSANLKGLRRFELQPPLVVKWFRNDEDVPFYQWIPEVGSRLFHHAYKDFIDVHYKHNDRPREMFRAIRVTRPVRELSGNYSCKVVQSERDDSPAGEYQEQTSSHQILIYDPPSEFEIRLNMSSRELRCVALVTGEDPTSVMMHVVRQDLDRWDRPLGPRLRLNDAIRSTTRPLRNGSKSRFNPELTESTLEQESSVRIECTVSLQLEDLKVLEMDTSRAFTCEIEFGRLLGAIEDRSDLPYHTNDSSANHVFQRSIRIVHESPLLSGEEGDYGDLNELPEPASWSGLDSVVANFRLAFNAVFLLYIYNLLV